MVAKDTIRIRRKRLDRWFWYPFDEAHPSKEAWREGGHLISGVAIDLKSVNESDGLKRYMPRLGYLADGEMVHAQNTTDDMAEIEALDGAICFAFLCYDQLHFFRRVESRERSYDNRLGFATSPANYGENREQAASKISGLIGFHEVYVVKPSTVEVIGGRLRFQATGKAFVPISFKTADNNKTIGS